MSMAHSDLIVDYIAFLLFIIATIIWPLWSRKKTPQTKANYVFAAGGGVSMGAMMLSLARGTLGVRTFLGSPSELFYRGSALWEMMYGMALAFPLVLILFIPVYCPLGITSVYQYLDLRFKSRAVRCLASATYIFRQVLTLGTTIFTPCVALNTVIGLPYWASIIGITSISVLFTTFGGLKAAIKADVIQGLTMIFISLIIILQCCFELKGVAPIFTVPYERDRLKFFQFTGDITTRVDTTSALFGQLFMSLSIYGCQQNFVQRYCSMNSNKLKKTLTLVIPVLLALFSLSWICGMGIFATYADCDPLTKGYIDKMDEILPFFIEDKFHYLPGIMGLFLGSLFNGALSIAVSNMNSLATVTFEDFLSHTPAFSKLKDNQQLLVIKLLGLVYGIIIMGVSFCVGMLPGVMETGVLVTSATSGPLLGVFLLAMFVPCSNWKGAIAGMLSSHFITIWITIGRFIYADKKIELLPLSTAGCKNDTFSAGIMKPYNVTPLKVNKNTTKLLENLFHSNLTQIVNEPVYENPLTPLYMITYMYYALLGTLITLIVGIVVSLIFKHDENDAYEEKLLHPFVLKLTKRYFKKLEKYLLKEDLKIGNGRMKNENNHKEVDNLAFEMTDANCNNSEQTQISIANTNGHTVNSHIEHYTNISEDELHQRNSVKI